MLALAAALTQDRAASTRALFLAAVADLERRLTSGEADAAAAGTLAAVLQSLDHAQALSVMCQPKRTTPRAKLPRSN